MTFKAGDLVRTNSKIGRYVYEKWQKYPDFSELESSFCASPYWRTGYSRFQLHNDLGLIIEVSSNGFCMVQFIKCERTLILKSRWLKKARK